MLDGDGLDGATPETSAAGKYTFHYADRFSEKEIEGALESLGDGADIDMLLNFQSVISPAMRNRLVARLESAPVLSPRADLYLAQHFETRDPEKAKMYLRRAALMMEVTGEDSSRSTIENLAKKLKLGKQTAHFFR